MDKSGDHELTQVQHQHQLQPLQVGWKELLAQEEEEVGMQKQTSQCCTSASPSSTLFCLFFSLSTKLFTSHADSCESGAEVRIGWEQLSLLYQLGRRSFETLDPKRSRRHLVTFPPQGELLLPLIPLFVNLPLWQLCYQF